MRSNRIIYLFMKGYSSPVACFLLLKELLSKHFETLACDPCRLKIRGEHCSSASSNFEQFDVKV